MKTILQPYAESTADSIQFEIEMLQDLYDSEESIKEVSKSKINFLVVDDDYDLVTYIQDCLITDFKKVTVIAVASAEIALKELKVKLPDILITDLIMPGMNGFDLISKLRLSQSDTEVKVLVITGKELLKSESQKLTELGISGILRKPFDSEKLKSIIDKMIEKN